MCQSNDANFEGSYPYLIEENYVNHHDSSVVTSRNRDTTIAVDSLSPNQFGFYNMYGNVSEWNAESGTGTVETVYSLDIQTPENPRILVAYFSYSGNTENGAKIIADANGVDLFEIQMENPYSKNIYEVSQADLNNNVHPVLASHVEDMEEYDIVILGYPTWWSTMPMPVYSFLEEYDFSGKVILPFSSHGGTRFGDSISDLSKTAVRAYVGQGFEYYYSGGSDLSGNLMAWLASNGIEVR